jgi:hypothetical protein
MTLDRHQSVTLASFQHTLRLYNQCCQLAEPQNTTVASYKSRRPKMYMTNLRHIYQTFLTQTLCATDFFGWYGRKHSQGSWQHWIKITVFLKNCSICQFVACFLSSACMYSIRACLSWQKGVAFTRPTSFPQTIISGLPSGHYLAPAKSRNWTTFHGELGLLRKKYNYSVYSTALAWFIGTWMDTLSFFRVVRSIIDIMNIV